MTPSAVSGDEALIWVNTVCKAQADIIIAKIEHQEEFMSVAAREQTRAVKKSAAELMDELNTDTARLHAWIRTQANAPAQRPWFADTSESRGQLASGRVAANQLKMLPHRWRWREISPYLFKIAEIARNAEVKPIETTDRQGILLTNPGLGGRLQITNTIRCAIAIYNPGDLAPAHIHSPNASRTILSDRGGYTNVEGERCECRRGDIVLTPNGTWHDHGNSDAEPMIWIDMLDWPLIEYLDCVWVDQNYSDATRNNAKSQPEIHGDGHSTRMYGNGGMKPVFTLFVHEKEQELGRELTVEEYLELAEASAGTERDLSLNRIRVRVHENPYALVPLDRRLFRGPFDERYGEIENTGRWGRVYGGRGVVDFEEKSPVAKLLSKI